MNVCVVLLRWVTHQSDMRIVSFLPVIVARNGGNTMQACISGQQLMTLKLLPTLNLVAGGQYQSVTQV